MTAGFSVRDGRICRDGEPLLVLGVNYLPSGSGCRLWTEGDLAEIEQDFKEIGAAGLNTVRIFLFWRDAEPAEGQLDQRVLRRLADVVSAARRHGLLCIVSLLTIWMNGQRLDLTWRDGRSLWRDRTMLARQEALVRDVSTTLSGFGNVLAYDLGDEIANVDPAEAGTLSASEVARWRARLAGAIRRAAPGSLVLQANDASGVFTSSAFGADNAPGLDLVGIHGFPPWSPGSIESTMSYKATNLVPFLVGYARAYGVPFVDELGSYGVDEDTAAAYLRAATASALANGAAGVVPWCWKDITSTAEPYRDRPAERSAGLNRSDGSAKPAMREYQELIRTAQRLVPHRPRPPVAVHLGERIRTGSRSYLDRDVGTLATFFAHLLLKRAHLDFVLVTDRLDGYPLVICPSVEQLTLPDIDRLTEAAERGATVYLSSGSHLHGFPGERLAGARFVDYALVDHGKASFAWGSDEWPVDWSGSCPTTLRATTGEILASFADGSPALVANTVGAGRFVFCNVPFERQIDGPGRLTAFGWQRLYQRLARLAGVTAAVDCPEPDVEIVPIGVRRVVVVNHAAVAVRTRLVRDGETDVPELGLLLAAKDWKIVDFG